MEKNSLVDIKLFHRFRGQIKINNIKWTTLLPQVSTFDKIER